MLIVFLTPVLMLTDYFLTIVVKNTVRDFLIFNLRLMS
jgi:hypothetical protein